MQKEVKKHRRTSKRVKRKRIFLTVFIIFALALLCGLSLTVFFPIKHLKISGSELYDAETLARATNIKTSDNLLLANEESILKRLQEELPFVDNIKLTKKFPDTLYIKVSDATERFCFEADGVYYSTDEKLRILKEYSSVPENLIFIKCQTKVSEGDIRSIVFDDILINENIDVIIKSTDKFSLKTDYIDMTDIYSLKMGIDSRFTIEFGSSEYFEDKLALMFKMLENKDENESGIIKLDMWTPSNPKGSYFKNEN